MEVLLQAILPFIFTVLLGTIVAHTWQARAAKETRFFEASKTIYEQMIGSAERLTVLAGRRIYATQRICMVERTSPNFEGALTAFRAVNIEWNERLLEMELAVRTLFRNSYLSSFENLQSELREVTAKAASISSGQTTFARRKTVQEINVVRHHFFKFAEEMFEEAKMLHRQMHFGVRIDYSESNLSQLSTPDLVKLLFVSSKEKQAVIRSPSDFGTPVSVWDARFGVNE